MGRCRLPVMLVLTVALICRWSVASAQTQQQHDWCYSPSATDDQTIEGCTALIEHGGLQGRELAIVLYDRGLSYENKNQLPLALEDFSQAVALDPSYAEAFNDRGNTLFKMHENERAITDYDKAIALKPTALYYSNRGYVYFKMDNLDKALPDLDQSINMDPNVGRFHVNRALVFIARHDCASALQDLLAAKRLNWNFDSEMVYVRTQCGAVMDPLGAAPAAAGGH